MQRPERIWRKRWKCPFPAGKEIMTWRGLGKSNARHRRAGMLGLQGCLLDGRARGAGGRRWSPPRPLAVKAKKARKGKNEKLRGTLQSHLSAGQRLKPVPWLMDHLVESTCGDRPSPEGCHLLLSLHLEQMLQKKTNKTLSALGDLGQYLYLRRVAFSFDPEGDKLGASSLKQRNWVCL